MQGAWSGCFQGYRGEAMHYLGYELRRIYLPRTPVNRDAGGYCLGLDSAEPFAAAELTSRTPETRRNPSISESSSSCLLPLPNTNSASSSSSAEPGRTTIRSKGTSDASISSLRSANGVPRSTTSLTRLASLRLGNILAFSGLASTSSAKANSVAETAARNMPPPTASPTAATAQMLAAVVSPLTTSLRKMIVPAPMKPMPLATWAATREGSRMTWRSLRMSENPKIDTTMKRADPSETRAWVLIPAAHSNLSRSSPTRQPKTAATTRRKTSSSADIILRPPPLQGSSVTLLFSTPK